MTRFLIGWVPTEEEAVGLLNDLKSQGLDASQMGMIHRQVNEAPFIGKDMAQNAARGAAAGGVLGGVGGALFAALGTVLIPGALPLVAGGVAVSVLAGAGGGALAGGQLAGMFPSFTQEEVEGNLREGNVMVLAESGAHEAAVKRVFNQYQIVNPRVVDLHSSDVQHMQSPQSTSAIASDAHVETPSEGLSNSKAFLAKHPEAMDTLYDE